LCDEKLFVEFCAEVVAATSSEADIFCTFGAMTVTKVSNSLSDLQGHSRSLTLAPFDRPHMISY